MSGGDLSETTFSTGPVRTFEGNRRAEDDGRLRAEISFGPQRSSRVPDTKKIVREPPDPNYSGHNARRWNHALEELLDDPTARLTPHDRPCARACFPAIWCHERTTEPKHGPHLSIATGAG